MNAQPDAKKIGAVIAKYWSDEKFAKQLAAAPETTLRAEGIDVPQGVSIKLHENTASVVHLAIPAKPDDLSDEALDKVAGGGLCPFCITVA